MKKIYTIIILLVIGAALQSNAQNVNIPDTAFKKVLINDTLINTNKDTAIQVSEAIQFNGYINVSKKSIYDLTGIQSFVNINGLDCSYNNITSLDITSNKVLIYLDCSSNKLIALNVSAHTTLHFLNCQYNQLTNLDITNCIALSDLKCYTNKLTSLNLTNCTALSSIDCGGNALTSLNLTSTNSLNYLYCTLNKLTNLILSSNKNLITLICNSNLLTSLDVTSCTSLKNVDCSFNLLASIDVSSNIALASLICYYNSLTSIKFHKNLDLLNCYHNLLTTLNLSNTNLRSLDCSKNLLTSLNLSNNNLKGLICNNNQFTTLDTKLCPSLIMLNCSNNYLKKLYTINLLNLNYLECNRNQIQILNADSCPKLSDLYCTHNQLNELNLSKNTLLNELICDSNNLKKLNIQNGNNKQLGFFSAKENPSLFCIQVNNVNDAYFNWYKAKDPTASFSINCDTAKIVTIPDVNFKAVLVTNPKINTSGDNEIQVYEAVAYKDTIKVNNLNIADLTGIEAFTNITYLDCRNNKLTSLKLPTGNTLTYIDCSNNQITNLDASNNTALSFLKCDTNKLATIKVAGDTALVTLRCTNNNLLSLNVSTNKALNYLYCSSNKLDSLDVSNNKALTQLLCDSNNLKVVNVQNGFNKNFTKLDFSKNPLLTCIQVDDVSYSDPHWALIKDGTADFSTNCSAPAKVYIADPKLKAILLSNNAINTNSDNEIQVSEAVAYKGSIAISNKDIYSMTGIEAFTAITSLDCSNNHILSLNLSANSALTSLNCTNNELMSLNVQNGNNIKFSNFNVTTNPNLTCIQVNNSAYSNTNWPNKDATASYSTDCYNNTAIVNIPDYNFKTSLLQNNSINTIYDNEIQVSEAASYTGDLNVSSKFIISDLTGIAAFTHIKKLFCSNQQFLTTINLTNNTELTEVWCVANKLTSFQLIGLRSLKTLYCNDNKLTQLDVSTNAGLKFLNCISNSLINLDFSKNLTLENIDCSYNNLTSLNVSKNYLLANLSCSYNNLTSLNVSQNFSLAGLGCGYNKLTSLDVSNNYSLDNLYCGFNKLTSLNIKNGYNFKLTKFDATQNPSLTCIQVDSIAYMNLAWAKGKDLTASYSANCNYATSCSAYFTLQPDVTTPHHWFAINKCKGAGKLTYSWSWGDGTANSVGANPSHTYSAPGYYKICVTITDSVGCSSTYCDNSTYIFKSSANGTMISVDVVNQAPIFTDISNTTSTYEISIYPNPTKEMLTLSGLPQTNQTINISNIIGELVQTESSKGANNVELNVSNLPSGLYFISLGNQSYKFIKN